jgi:Protein of unknown function (DUF3800)
MAVRICYVDESGDTRPLASSTSAEAPVCVIGGVVFEQDAVPSLTREFLRLKQRRFPKLAPRRGRLHERVLCEIKGSDLRRTLRKGRGRNARRHTLGFLDRLLALLEEHEAQIFARVWVKEIGGGVNGRALYASSMQALCSCFQRLLDEHDDHGFVIADHRTPALNVPVSHSVFTQKFKHSGDEYDRILEMPTFGDSRNHVGIQIADLLCSALLFPMATYAYCRGHVTSVHVDNGFSVLPERFGQRLGRLQFRFDEEERKRGGITVDDRLGHRHGGLLLYPKGSISDEAVLAAIS